LGVKETNQLVILDAFLLGMGVCKIGYATQFGMDIPDEEEQKKREKSKFDRIMARLGLKKEAEEEKKQNVELDERIVAERPYITWVSPFDFLIDPRATSIYNAQWVGQKITKPLDEVKRNKALKNTAGLKGTEPEKHILEKVPSTQLDRFKTIDLYEIHYKTNEGLYLLILAKDGEWKYLYHGKSVYEMDGFPFEILTFNKHGHALYPVSDVDIIKPLQMRLTETIDAILDQIDKFVPKIGVDETKLTEAGRVALRDGNVGSIVSFKGNPNEFIKEIDLTQLKADLNVFTEKLIDMIALETGLTRAQLTGLTTAETATEAQIGQAGANVRLSARAEEVADFSNRQARKLWQVIRQFVDLDDVELITGESSVDERGIPRFQWLEDRPDLTKAELRFIIEVGSAQKPDLAVIRKEWENFINIMAKTDVIALMQQQGTKLDVAEVVRTFLKLFPEMIRDTSRILKPAIPGGTGQLTPQQVEAQLSHIGGGNGVRENLIKQQPPTPTSFQEQIGGEAGQL